MSTDADQPAAVAPPSGHLAVVGELAKSSPGLAAIALVFGLGGGTLGSVFVAPVVEDELEKHAADPYAHGEQFTRIDRNEDRLERIERTLDRQGTDLSEIKAGLAAAIREVERR